MTSSSASSPGAQVSAGVQRAGGGTSAGWRLRLVALLAAGLIRLLRATIRMRHDGDSAVRGWEREGRRFILAFWHRHMLLMRYCYRGERVTMLISRHRDGELIARTIGRLGIDSTRGSTSAGGASGLRGLLRKAAQGYDLGFTPDGPRGPAGVVKPGVLMAAAATGLPIQPIGFAARPCLRLRSWDRFVVPLPLGRAWLVYGEPLHVERGSDLEAAARELAARLSAAEDRAERLVERRR